MNRIPDILGDEALRQRLFPVTRQRVFLAHAGVTALPHCAAEALRWFADRASEDQQEAGEVWKRIQRTRQVAAELVGARENEIALLGPTALGLNLVADGLDWQPGDEVICYQDDYPANVYPWLKLAARGVKPVFLQPSVPGRITPELVTQSITPKTKLVALASAHFLSGYRIDVDTIGKALHARGILFCLDAIQTLGAFPLSVTEVDFFSADSHKWMLGPLGAGVLYVKEANFTKLRPTLLGSWNVQSPDFIAQDRIDFYEGARRYEPGSLNVPGILSMLSSLELLQEIGIEEVARRLLLLRRHLVPRMQELGFTLYGTPQPEPAQLSGIMAFRYPDGPDPARLQGLLAERKISVSHRHNRQGESLLRVTPHFYNTEAELDLFLKTCAQWQGAS